MSFIPTGRPEPTFGVSIDIAQPYYRAPLRPRRSSTERIATRNARSFTDDHELIGLHRRHDLLSAVRPADRQVRRRRLAEPEVEPPIVRRVEAGLRGDLLHLAPPAVAHDDARADGAPVRLHAHEQDLQPVTA